MGEKPEFPALDSHGIVRLERDGLEEGPIYAFILERGESLLRIREFYDFVDFGVSILRREDLTAVRAGEDERVYGEILAALGVSPDHPLEPESAEPEAAPAEGSGWLEVPLGSWEDCLSFLKGEDAFVAIESESGENAGTFLVGIPSEIEGGQLWLLPCDSRGRWDEEEVAIDLAEITRVQVDNPYLRGLSLYAAQRLEYLEPG
ncbi:MAG: hypothetical protein AAF725_22140 [Acidobacteriota bacterium]